jgi:hypothetical protein
VLECDPVAREVVIGRTIAASPLLQFFANRPGDLAEPETAAKGADSGTNDPYAS